MSKLPDLRRGATAHDEGIGAKIRRKRIALGMTQRTLGERLGVSFQQIQKYENGKDRMGSARLLRAAQVLDMQIADLLVKDDALRPPASDIIDDFLASKDGAALAAHFTKLDPRARRAIVELAKALSKTTSSP